MMKRLFFFLLAFTLVLSGCSKLMEVQLRDVQIKSFELLSTSSANIEVEYVIHNPSSRELFLDNATGFLKRSGVNFAHVTLVSADTVAAKRISVNNVVFKLDILDPLSLLSMGLNISKWKYSDFKVDARAVVKTSRGGRKVLKFKDMSIESMLKRI
ncbi:MAG: hypothetical protein EOM16_06980 [Bacteroidia bacterium]|nr:hypothetical protein [Bacteroidales bacterium]MDD3300937.1 hypothetical protein [Bacteroidales bacterium]MDD3843739.1 hypothetical protein [Bacteroidales bacterium]MDD4618413.1 hypothetical protein [Bacteroidales bacterium]NCC46762.1 hypothetical protein [Bacteroidia bacterium]